jgi:uracil-DNA glycosylase
LDAQAKMKKLCDEIRTCARCPLAAGRTHAVPGVGPVPTELLFIGEGPGFHEDRQGLPFVGAAGKFLDDLLASIGIERNEVYIANVVKCRPPNNRDPEPGEIEACQPYLDRQIELLQPRVIVTLGRFSMARYFVNASISRIHGQPKRQNGTVVVPMFHPAAALHQPKYRELIEADFRKLPGFLAEARKQQDSPPTPSAAPQQLSLF